MVAKCPGSFLFVGLGCDMWVKGSSKSVIKTCGIPGVTSIAITKISNTHNVRKSRFLPFLQFAKENSKNLVKMYKKSDFLTLWVFDIFMIAIDMTIGISQALSTPFEDFLTHISHSQTNRQKTPRALCHHREISQFFGFSQTWGLNLVNKRSTDVDQNFLVRKHTIKATFP